MIYIHLSEAIAKPEFLDLFSMQTLEDAAEKTLQATRPNEDCDVSLVITNDDQIHLLNRQFLGVDAPTDVLSFPSGEIDPDSGTVYMGDVIISLPHARQQSTAGGHALEAELQLLVVHGILHLLDYDHTDEEGKERMWEIQAAILRELNCPIEGPYMP